MALPRIKVALEKAIKALDPSFSTAYENVEFTPQANTPYQDIQIVPRAPDNQTVGSSYYREVGELQVFLNYPSNTGTSACMLKAVQLRDYFKRGNTYSNAGIDVNIMKTPSISSGSVIGDRYVVVVVINYSAGVFKA